MQIHSQIVAGIALAGLLAWPDPGAAAPPVTNVIRTVDVADRDGAVEVEIRATRAPSYTVFKLQDPPGSSSTSRAATSPALPRPSASIVEASRRSPRPSTRTRRPASAGWSSPSTRPPATRSPRRARPSV